MKFLGIVAIILYLLCSCTGKQQPSPATPAEATSASDSIQRADSIRAVETEREMERVDEYFIDFIYAFTLKPEYQMARIQFPLPCLSDSTTSYISKDKWYFSRLHLKEPVYTVIFGNVEATEMEKSDTLTHVRIERFDMQDGKYRSYVFCKKKGEWWMTAIEDYPLAEYHDVQFLRFYQQFATDEDFQRNHLKSGIHVNLSGSDDSMEGMLDASQWPSFRPDLPHGVLTNIDYGQSASYGSMRVMALEGRSNGFYCLLYFVKERGGWFLTRYEN